MTDIEIAREAAAKAQVNPHVASMILSGRYDAWPNVVGALYAVQAIRSGPRIVIDGEWFEELPGRI